eukprot:1317242-Rhodomonas_salina.1
MAGGGMRPALHAGSPGPCATPPCTAPTAPLCTRSATLDSSPRQHPRPLCSPPPSQRPASWLACPDLPHGSCVDERHTRCIFAITASMSTVWRC